MLGHSCRQDEAPVATVSTPPARKRAQSGMAGAKQQRVSNRPAWYAPRYRSMLLTLILIFSFTGWSPVFLAENFDEQSWAEIASNQPGVVWNVGSCGDGDILILDNLARCFILPELIDIYGIKIVRTFRIWPLQCSIR